MHMTTPIGLHFGGMLAIMGTCLYAIGDKLLLNASISAIYQVDSPVSPRLPCLNVIPVWPWWRLVWRSVLGICAAPLLLAGIWQVYQGLAPAGPWLALPPALLLVYATVIERTFIQGSLTKRGERVPLCIDDDLASYGLKVFLHQPTVLLNRERDTLIYVMLASVWFAVAVVSGQTHFPIWMTAVNPVTVILLWLASQSILPKRVVALSEGAGFNLAYLIFFTLTTVTLW